MRQVGGQAGEVRSDEGRGAELATQVLDVRVVGQGHGPVDDGRGEAGGRQLLTRYRVRLAAELVEHEIHGGLL